MAEFDAHTTVEEAIDALARGMVKRSSDGQGHDVDYFSLLELMAVERRRAANVAAGKEHFGLRMTRLDSPSTG
jgi:hypothetical protein